MTREAIADRLLNYADAVVAFSAVNSLAFLVTLAEPEIQCSLVNIRWFVISGQLLHSLVNAVAVVLLRRAEIKARTSGSPTTPDVERFLRGFFAARLAIVGALALLTVGALAALSRPGCTS